MSTIFAKTIANIGTPAANGLLKRPRPEESTEGPASKRAHVIADTVPTEAEKAVDELLDLQEELPDLIDKLGTFQDDFNAAIELPFRSTPGRAIPDEFADNVSLRNFLCDQARAVLADQQRISKLLEAFIGMFEFKPASLDEDEHEEKDEDEDEDEDE
jgi:3-methyladenine DNA glycosylase/8-oxoguanine DNA glycosylase